MRAAYDPALMSAYPTPRHRLATLATAWVATRALMLWLLTHDDLSALGSGGVSHEVRHLYFRWYGILSHGAYPAGDRLWQYPPGAGPVLLAPGLLPGLTYFHAFVALTLLADAVIAWALARAGQPARPQSARRGPVDTGPAPAAAPSARPVRRAGHGVRRHLPVDVVAFPARGRRVRRARRPGEGLARAGPRGRPRGRTTREAWTSAVLTAVTLLAVLATAFSNPFDFLRQQGGRGVQIESLGGTVLGLARHLGWPGRVRYRYGAMEFVGPYVQTVATVSLGLTAAAFGLLLLWRVRARRWTAATPYDAALAAVLLFTVTSRVISPQYMVWLLGLAAVCLTSRHTTQRPVAVLILAATVVSSVAYPGLYREVIHSTWAGCLLMLLRNGLLTAAAVLSFTRLWRSGLPVPQRLESAAPTRNPHPIPAVFRTGR